MSDQSKNNQKVAPEEAALEKRVDSIMNESPQPDPQVKINAPPTPVDTTTPVVSAATTAPTIPPVAKLDDPDSDAAVDQIVAHDSSVEHDTDEESAVTPKRKLAKKGQGLKSFFARKLTWIVVVLVLIVLCFAVPISRYKLLGLVLKKSYAVSVIDSKTATAVSNATVTLDGKIVKTNATGEGTIKVPVGATTLTITKRYYQSFTKQITVGLKSQTAALRVKLVATGRQVPLEVTNTLTGQPLDGVTISVLGTTARTNSSGRATIVLPTKATTYHALLTAESFNSLTTSVAVTSSVVASNDFKLTPAGKIYFLSNASGNVDVMSSNLDGTDQQIALAGTGNETANSTQLFNSSDWKYLALVAQRSSNTNDNGLYLINTADNNSLTTIDSGNDDFTPIGWAGHYFVYEVQNLSLSNYQAGQYVLKSYDADTGHLIILDQSNAAGNVYSNIEQYLSNFYLFNSTLIYTKQWQGDSSVYSSGSYTSSIDTIGVNGQNQAPLQQFTLTPGGNDLDSLFSLMYGPEKIYFEGYFTNGDTQFYSYSNAALTPSSITADDFNNINYTAGVTSPSGDEAAFSTNRNGQFVLLSGAPDADASSQRTLATLSNNYNFYGWYTDSYIILSYKSATLYIMPASGLSSGQQPYKIANYLQ